MTWVFIGLVVVVVAAVAAVAVGHGAGLTVAQPDRPEVALPAGRLLGAADLETVEFSVGLRGYRMDEVDDLLSRLAAEIAERDERLRTLLTPAPTATRPTPTPPAVSVVAVSPDGSTAPAAPPAGVTGSTRTTDSVTDPAEDRPAAHDSGPVPGAEPVGMIQPVEPGVERDWADTR